MNLKSLTKREKIIGTIAVLALVAFFLQAFLPSTSAHPREDEHHAHDHAHEHTHDHDHDGHEAGHDHHHGHAHHHDEAEHEETPWSISKAEVLRQRMMVYRQPEQGRYKEYWAGQTVEWQGVSLPDQAIAVSGAQADYHLILDNQPAPIYYSETGQQEGWNLVAIFSNQDDQAATEKHTYLFLIHQDGRLAVAEPTKLEGQNLSLTTEVESSLLSTFETIIHPK